MKKPVIKLFGIFLLFILVAAMLLSLAGCKAAQEGFRFSEVYRATITLAHTSDPGALRAALNELPYSYSEFSPVNDGPTGPGSWTVTLNVRNRQGVDALYRQLAQQHISVLAIRTEVIDE